MSERYQYDDRVELKDGGEPVAIHLLDDSQVRLANAAYQAGREEALREVDRFLEVATTTGSSVNINAARRECARILAGDPTYPTNPKGEKDE